MGRNSRGFLTGITTWWRKKIIAVRHSFYRKRLVRRLTNLAPSILSLDCVGGVMAHDLRLRFNSPTVNLFFESCGDFIDYVADLRYYSQAELCECPYAYEGARRYPVGMLKGNGTLPDIKIHFLHYRSFEEAREKWLERSGRLDFDNLCVVMQAAELDEGLLERFERLPISRKVILGYETLPLQARRFSRCVRWILSCRAGSWIITVCRVGVISTISITSHFSTTEPFERKIAPPRRNSATDSGV